MEDNLVTAPNAPAPEAVAPQAEAENAALEQDPSQAADEPKEAAKAEDDVVFPKKAINALSRRDKQIGKLRAENQQILAELTRLRDLANTPQKSTPKDGPPSEDDFDNYGDFLRATARYEARQEAAEGLKKQQQASVTQKEQEWYVGRVSEVENMAREAIKTVPDYEQVMAEHADVVDSFPPELEQIFLRAERPEMAFYALAKEGRLESLLNMSPYQAAMEVGRAQDRGVAMAQQRQQTKAPQPIAPARGMGSATKSLHDLSEDELVKRWKL